MPGTSQGSSYPATVSTNPDDELDVALAAAKKRVKQAEALAADQRGSSFMLPVAESAYTTVNAWTGRHDWLNQCRWAIRTPDGERLRKYHKVALPTFLIAIVAIAAFADSRTGRDVAAAGRTIARHAGIGSAKTIQRTRAILRALGLAVEMARGRILTGDEHYAAEIHHGGRQHRAASRWALTSPVWAITGAAAERRRKASDSPAKGKSRGRNSVHLSRSSYVRKKNSPKKINHQRARAREATRHAPNPIPRRPRPLHLQRAAAELLRIAVTLDDGRHPGSVCDAIESAGIDTTRWRGRDIARALDHDTRERGWVWPHRSQITDPGRLLRWRLARIDFTGPSPADRAAEAHADRVQRAAARAADRGPGSTPAGRAAALTLFRRSQKAKQEERRNQNRCLG
ncbi:Rep protein [Tomitella cavernea]|uniref:Rep protein n=1 Tax=Tomitella cavernea TaxID=1387982 RepID=UPI001A935835|nr:Rep protein [Tomitella cavernea]